MLSRIFLAVAGMSANAGLLVLAILAVRLVTRRRMPKWGNCLLWGLVELYSDSKYVIDALSKGWVYGWKKKGWIKSDKKPALNVDLWQELLPLVARHEVHYHWVKGHASNEKNNRCDQLAVAESKKF